MKTSFLFQAVVSILVSATAATIPVSAQSGSPVLQAPANVVGDVFANYFKIQKSLASDSLEGVGSSAMALANLVSQDHGGVFRSELIAQAQALASASDLTTARQIFKAVSGYLIQTWRAGHGPGGTIHEAYSPADNVDWLQEGEVLQNPYQGRACEHCGTIVR
jgi:hypothetical protein